MVVLLSAVVSSTSHSHVGVLPRFSGSRTPETVVSLSKLASESLTTQNVGSINPEIAQSFSELDSRSSGLEPKAGLSSSHTVPSESPKPNTNKRRLPEILVLYALHVSLHLVLISWQPQSCIQGIRENVEPVAAGSEGVSEHKTPHRAPARL